MPIDLYPNIAKVKRNGVYQNLPGFVQQSVDADIEAMIANSESTTTAQYEHPKNSFFILNDVLYQADENIAVNDIIAVGTNCHVENIGNAIYKIVENAEIIERDLNLLELFGRERLRCTITSENKWSTTGARYSRFINLNPFRGETLTIKGNATNGSVLCLLKDMNYVAGQYVNYATGASRSFIQANEIKSFTIPNDCDWGVILDYWGIDYMPQILSVNHKAIIKHTNINQFGLTVDKWCNKCCMFANYFLSSSFTPMQGDCYGKDMASYKTSDYIPISGKMLILPLMVTVGTTFTNHGVSLFDKNFKPIMGRAIQTFLNPNAVDRYCIAKIYIPENATFFRTTYWADDSEVMTGGLAPNFYYDILQEIPDEYKQITHELPVDTFMQNSIRRARQLTDIKWTPRVNIPRYSLINGTDIHFLDWFYANHEYIGIPYSGAGDDESNWYTIKDWGYTHYWVGQHIPIDSFVTACRYPNSIMGEKVNQSEPSYDSSPYGDVCTALVNYVVDGPTPLRSINGFFNTDERVFRSTGTTVANFDVNNLSIGDFLYTQAHVIFISDIIRDNEGNVINIEMSEETTVGNSNNNVLGEKFGGVARRKMWNVNEWKTRYASYVIWRRTTFYGISYTPSKFVDTGNEGDRETMVDYPCIPYLGEGAVYKVGYIHNSKILIGATGFTGLTVLKDGEPFNTFDVTGLTEISVGFSAAGEYEAWLTVGATRTLSCHWTVEP